MNYRLKRSRAQEKRAARDLGGRVQPGSGSRWHSKGDVKTPSFLVECKTTTRGSYSLRRDLLRKIELEAARMGKVPVFQVEFTNAPQGQPQRFAVIRWEDFLGMQSGEEEAWRSR